ncbi:PilZ domain-containing protein [Desulfonema magnum]|uniref:PilZ domain-containing protein n=1 Tax=Desulfonema magnum TaxID=45655 RepID=A0A975BY14_9BACT|nr:PilZ domain-containing protein [Desulfonema magnum]QTA93423.1 PilZ domain-containing protein [Desulfonema magnum]
MAEKRKLKRRHLIYYLDVFERKTGQFVGKLVDITTDGVMLTTEFPIKSGVILQLIMLLPEEIRDHKQITFDARTQWVEKSIKPDFYDIGFELLSISHKDIEIIESLIFDFSFKD